MDDRIAGKTSWSLGERPEAAEEEKASAGPVPEKVWLNGGLVAAEEARISAFDHGFLYGDGLYETLRVYSGRLWRAAEHLDRLEEGCRRLELAPIPARDDLLGAMRDLVEANGLGEAYVRLTVSRGPGAPRPRREGMGPPTVFMVARAFDVYAPEIYQTGAAIALVPT